MMRSVTVALTFLVALVTAFAPVVSGAQMMPGLNVKVVSLTSPVSPGSQSTLTVQTDPNATCTPIVRYKSGTSGAAGLQRKTANAQGQVSWTWKVGSNVTAGTWPVTVRCTAKGKEGTAEASLEVKK
jgi:hypothetical protein